MSRRVHAHSKRKPTERAQDVSPKPFRAAKESPATASTRVAPPSKGSRRKKVADEGDRKAAKTKTKASERSRQPKTTKPPKARKAAGSTPVKAGAGNDRIPKDEPSDKSGKAGTSAASSKGSVPSKAARAVKSAASVPGRIPRPSRGPGRSRAPRSTKATTAPKGQAKGPSSPKAPGRTGALLHALRPSSARRRSASSAGKDSGPRKKEPTSADVRRNRVPLALAAFCALVVLAVGFPAAGLLAQHQQLSAASAQLHQVVQDNKRLADQEHALNSKTEINRLARQDYQLVSPGQTLYDVLPSSGSHGPTPTVPAGSESGDPGDQPLVAPSDAPDMSPDPGLPEAPPSGADSSSSTATRSGGTAASPGSAAPRGPSSFWGRVANTLEFWQ